VKKIIIYVLLATIVFQWCGKLLVYVNFKMQQDYYAKNECVKKDIENNDCEGNCCLKKQLAAEEKKAPTLPNVLKQKTELLFITATPLVTFKTIITYKIHHHTHYTYVMPASVVNALLRPPQQV
jgi:hypothetical protein